MAGYIMTIDNYDALRDCVIKGIYSTIFGDINYNVWNTPQEGTYADYFSMKKGDSIYFFHERKVYGIGQIIDVDYDCKFLNYKDADIPKNYSEKEYKERKPLLKRTTPKNRCFCTFKPSPYFFMSGTDMDDVLSSNPDKFRILRTMWKVSFIKIDEEEDKALRDIILKRNEEFIKTRDNVFPYKDKYIKEIATKLDASYRLNSYRILLESQKGKKIKHEMAIEAALCDILGKDNDTLFGKWDYISHQVPASPFKPIDYMDKMDIFGYKYIDGYDTISKYLVIEIKKDAAKADAVEQIMKYVDWINQEYSHGDYSMIEAYIIAADFSETIIEKRNNECIRNFTKGYRPTTACTWSDCKLVKYEYDNEEIIFKEING
ncbi:MAG: hypothetical protein K6E10_03160 [Eubacterium sp.]|nr:hypothetical protein [Eubacterium sp.]